MTTCFDVGEARQRTKEGRRSDRLGRPVAVRQVMGQRMYLPVTVNDRW